MDLMIIIVKYHEESEILPYLQDNKLKYCIFLSDGRRHETFESETKDSITHDTEGSMNFLFP